MATDEGTKRKLQLSELYMINAVGFGLVSLVIRVVAEMVAYIANHYQRKHAAMSVGLLLFVIAVSITVEIHERWERRNSPEPPTVQIAPQLVTPQMPPPNN